MILMLMLIMSMMLMMLMTNMSLGNMFQKQSRVSENPGY